MRFIGFICSRSVAGKFPLDINAICTILLCRLLIGDSHEALREAQGAEEFGGNVPGISPRVAKGGNGQAHT
jgi:hypothetical protein